MAIKGTLYGLAKTKNDVDGLEKFKSMIKEVNSSGAVVIDGRNIAADSIFANQISADAITAKQIKAGAITTDHITTSGISADKIKAGQLTAQNNASWLNLNNGQFSFGGGKIVYNGSNLSINVESLKITNKPVATQDDAKNLAEVTVDGLEVTDRNLVKNSNIFLGSGGSGASGITPSVTPEGYLQVIVSSGNGNWLNGFTPDANVLTEELKEGDKFTISFTMKSPNSTGVPTIYLKSGMGYFSMKGTMGKEFSTVYYTGIWRAANVVSIHMGFSGLVGAFIIKDTKIQRGDKPTGWTPALEDVNSAIGSAQTDASNAKGKTDAWTYTGTTEINGGKIKADTVTAAQIAANTITATQIATNAITADKILAKSIIAGKIAANAVTADEIKAGSITADHITTLGITADKIKAGRLSATNNVSWLDMNNGQFNFGNGKISFNGSILALNVDSLSIASKPVATKEQVDASILDDKKIKDTRSTNQPPSWYFTNYPTQVVNEFKQRAVVGAPGTQTYGVLTTDVIWSSTSGGFITQTFKSGDGVFTRNGQTTGWTSWLQIDIEDRINNAVTTIDKTGVTVKDGSFYLQDNSSDVKYSLQAKTNPIKDHGFEMYDPRIKHPTYDIWEVEAYANLDGTSRPRTDSDVYMKGNPYIYVSFIKDETSSSTSNPIFGSISGVANSANYYSNLLTGWIKKGTTYTVSAFFKKVPLMTGGIPRIIVTQVRGTNNATVATLAHSAFSQVTSEVDAIRYSLKFTVPTSYNIDSGDKIRFEYLSSNANWVMIDGLQVSEASFPSQYNEDKAAFEVARGEYTFPILKANYVNATGGSFTGDVYTLGQFSAGRYISQELKAGTNLNNIVAEGWYFCPTSATVNSIANTPSNLAFSLFVEKHAGVKQTFTEYRDTYVHTFVRNMYNGYWGEWDIVVGEPIRYNISKENGWQNYGGSYSTPRYWRGSDGTVHLCGMTDGGTRTSGVRFGTLPVGYRPENREIFNVHAYDKTYTRIDVTPEGYILVMDSPKGYVSLSGISFVGRR